MRRWRLKVLLPVLLIHLVGIPYLVNRFLIFYEEKIWTMQRDAVEELMKEVEQGVAIHQIASGSRETLEKTVADLFKRYHFAALNLYDAHGRPVIQFGEPQKRKLIPQDVIVKKGETMEVTRWVRNEKLCQRCHGSERLFIGALRGTVSVSVSETARILRIARQQVLTLTIIVLVSIFSLVTFLLIFITQPIRRIMKTLEEVEGGDLSVRIPVRGRDEIAHMASRLNEVIANLQEARAEVERRHEEEMERAEQLATVGEISAGLAHEVKNPLAGMAGALEVLQEEMEEMGSPHVNVIGQLREETRRITAILNQLLNYARPVKPRPDWFSLESLLEDLQTIILPQCNRKRITFTLDIAPDLPEVYADPDILKQIFINVLQNAIQVLQPGGTIEFRITTDGEDQILYAVRDDGPGMDEKTRAKIFQPFFTTRPTGTGLGMALVHRLVTRVNGRIEVDSSPGEGTTITMILPRRCCYEDPDR